MSSKLQNAEYLKTKKKTKKYTADTYTYRAITYSTGSTSNIRIYHNRSQNEHINSPLNLENLEETAVEFNIASTFTDGDNNPSPFVSRINFSPTENSNSLISKRKIATQPSNASTSSADDNFSIPVMPDNETDTEIHRPFQLRTKYYKNPLLGFLNINSLRYKIVDLREVMERCLLDILVIEETKLNKDYKTELFVMNNYQYPMRRDRDEFGGGLMQYVRKGVVCNRISKY